MKRTFKLILSILVLAVCAANRHPDRMPTWDLRLLLSFDRGDASDRTSANRTPTVGAGATFGSRICDFNGGSTAVVSFPDDNAFDSFPLTVMCWVRIDAYTSFRTIMAKVTQTGTVVGWRLYHGGGISRGLGFYYGSNATNYRQTFSAVGTLSAGPWFHVCATVAANNDNPVLYINGVLQSVTVSNLGSVTSSANSESVRIGGLGGSEAGWSYHDGQIDDVRIYNRVLSAAEIGSIYSSGRP